MSINFNRRNRRSARHNHQQIERAAQRGDTIYAATPTYTRTRNSVLGTWDFYRGTVVSVTAKRDWLRRKVDSIVELDCAERGIVQLPASRLRWRGPEAFTSTPVSFEVVAMNVREKMQERIELLEGQLKGETKRPYDFDFKRAQHEYERLSSDLTAIKLLPQDIDQVAACIEREFDYPQRDLDVHGSRELYRELLSEAMGRLPFYDQLALNVLDGWANSFYEERTGWYYRSWHHDDVLHVLPNLAHLAVEGCAVGPDATFIAHPSMQAA